MSSVKAIAVSVVDDKVEKKVVAKGELVKKSSAIEVTPETIITILQYAIEAVSVATVDEEDRREYVMELVRDAIVDAPICDEREKLMLDMVDSGILGHTFDLVMSAANGKIDSGAALGVASVVAPRLWKRMLLCCSKKMNAID